MKDGYKFAFIRRKLSETTIENPAGFEEDRYNEFIEGLVQLLCLLATKEEE